VGRVFEAREAAAWSPVTRTGEYRRSHGAAGRIYLPTATYEEMAEWPLPAEAFARLARLEHDLEGGRFAEVLPFVRGGFWRHFVVKYAEVNTLHRLALRAGAKIHAMAPGREQTRALAERWDGEGHCPERTGL